MAQPSYIQKTLQMKPEVTKIFNDLEDWLNYCRLNLIEFNQKDLYKSKEYKDFQRQKFAMERKLQRENKHTKQEY